MVIYGTIVIDCLASYGNRLFMCYFDTFNSFEVKWNIIKYFANRKINRFFPFSFHDLKNGCRRLGKSASMRQRSRRARNNLEYAQLYMVDSWFDYATRM